MGRQSLGRLRTSWSSRSVPSAATCSRGLERRAPSEHPEQQEEGQLLRRQKFATPIDRGSHRPLPLGKVACAIGVHDGLQAVQHGLRRQCPQMCARQLERQRQPGQTVAQLAERSGVGVGGNAADGASPADRAACPPPSRPAPPSPAERRRAARAAAPRTRARSGRPAGLGWSPRPVETGTDRRASSTWVAALSRCSKLSSTSNSRRSSRCRATNSGPSGLWPPVSPSARARVGTTSSASVRAANATMTVPSEWPGACASAMATASRVLPTPPSPVSVISRAPAHQRSFIARTSASRPTSGVAGTVRL